MPSCNGRHLPLNNEGAGALWWHTEVQIPISNQAENPPSQIVREVDVCEGENPQGCHYPWIYLRKQWPALSFRWRCLAADLSAQRCPEDTSRTFPGVFLTACLPPGGQGHRVPPSLHALKRQQVTCMEATDASRQQRAWQYGGQSRCTQIWHKLVFWRIVQALFFVVCFWNISPDTALRPPQLRTGICACISTLLLEHIQTLRFPLFPAGKLLGEGKRWDESWALSS